MNKNIKNEFNSDDINHPELTQEETPKKVMEEKKFGSV